VSRLYRPAGIHLLVHPPTEGHRRPACCFSGISRLGKSISNPSSLRSRYSATFKCCLKCSIHLDSTWSLFVSSSPFFGRHMGTSTLDLFTSFNLCCSISIWVSSSSCLLFKRVLIFRSCLLIFVVRCSRSSLDGFRSASVLFLVHLFVEPLFSRLFSCVDDGVCRFFPFIQNFLLIYRT
jgi:hypothetical protein